MTRGPRVILAPPVDEVAAPRMRKCMVADEPAPRVALTLQVDEAIVVAIDMLSRRLSVSRDDAVGIAVWALFNDSFRPDRGGPR